jgi:DNA polymerase elongation subunit (family B)
MLIDIEYRNSKLVVSYLNEDGKIKIKYYPWVRPKKFEICNDQDPDRMHKLKTWDKKPVKYVETSNPGRYSIYEYLDALDQTEQELIFGYKAPEMYFMDIETEILDKFPDPVSAETRVLSVAIVFKEEVLCMGLRPLSEMQIADMQAKINEYFKKFNKKYELKYKVYDKEFSMLLDLFKNYIPKMALLTGWNFVDYDWVYLVNRCRKIGITPELASPTGRLIKAFEGNEELPMHRVIVDYMEIYKKWDTSIKVKESASLDFVSEKLLGLNKINYSGSLKALYKDDFFTFIYYNIVDTALVQLIHEQKNYISVLLGLANLAKVRLIDGFSTIAVTEGVLRRPMKDQLGIVLVKDYNRPAPTEKIKGGWVKPPTTGMHQWLTVYDFASLYPTTMRQFNIAPESYKGIKLEDEDGEYCVYDNQRIPIIAGEDILTVNDTVFKLENSVTKQTLENIYNERKKYKKVMLEKKDELKKKQNELAALMAQID